jgi:hypothetical protein
MDSHVFGAKDEPIEKLKTIYPKVCIIKSNCFVVNQLHVEVLIRFWNLRGGQCIISYKIMFSLARVCLSIPIQNANDRT